MSEKNWLAGLKPGDTIWLEADELRHRNRSQLLTVEKVGRKYLTASGGYQFELKGGTHSRMGWPRGRPYRSEAEASEVNAIAVHYALLRRDLNMTSDRNPPPGLTVERIAKARELLGLPA